MVGSRRAVGKSDSALVRLVNTINPWPPYLREHEKLLPNTCTFIFKADKTLPPYGNRRAERPYLGLLREPRNDVPHLYVYCRDTTNVKLLFSSSSCSSVLRTPR